MFHTTLSPSQGIGDSSQGLANAVLFVFFTSKVRERLSPSYWMWKRRVGRQPPECAPLVNEKAECAGAEPNRRHSETLSITPYSSLA